MNDFEARLEKLLNEQVDARVGERRPAPPHRFDTPSGTRSSGPRVRWWPPLLAAACVAVIVGGGVAGTQLLSSDRTPAGPRTGVPTVGPGPGTSVAPTTSSPAPTTGPSPTDRSAPRSSGPTPSRSGAKDGSDAPAPHVVQLGAASISLPAGWVARDYQRYLPAGTGSFGPSWCLTPASEPASSERGACPLQLTVPAVDDNPLDVDVEGGYASNPSPCGDVDIVGRDLDYADRTLGGRAAEWRQWRITCRNGKVVRYEQYVVPTGPAYILYTDQLDARVHDAMTEIATRSTLPAQTAPLRWMDRGYVRSIRRSGKSVQITLDRAVQYGARTVNANPATYRYTVPLSVWRDATTTHRVGSLVYLQSDGRRVVSVY